MNDMKCKNNCIETRNNIAIFFVKQYNDCGLFFYLLICMDLLKYLKKNILINFSEIE